MSKELELLKEKHFIFLDGQISIRHYKMEQKKLSIRELSDLFSGDNHYFPNIHTRLITSSNFRLFFYEPGGYEELTFEQYYDVLHSSRMNKILFKEPPAQIPMRASVLDLSSGTVMSLSLDIVNRDSESVTLEWFVNPQTEATTSMLRFLVATAYQNGIIHEIVVHKMSQDI